MQGLRKKFIQKANSEREKDKPAPVTEAGARGDAMTEAAVGAASVGGNGQFGGEVDPAALPETMLLGGESEFVPHPTSNAVSVAAAACWENVVVQGKRAAEGKSAAMAAPKKRAGVSAAPLHMDANYKPPTFPKTDSERVEIQEAIQHFFAFSAMLESKEQSDLLTDAFEMKNFEAGTTLIEQGSAGLEFFVLLSGDVECSVSGVGVVKTCRGQSPDCYFGELALLYNNPRAASVMTTTPVKVAVLDQDSFKHIIPLAQKLAQDLHLKLLHNISQIDQRNENEQLMLMDAMKFDTRAKGEIVLQMPFDGVDEIILDSFCIVLKGQVEIVRTKNAGGAQSSEIIDVQDLGRAFARIKLEDGDSKVVATVLSPNCKTIVARQSTMNNFDVGDDFWVKDAEVSGEVQARECVDVKPKVSGRGRRTQIRAVTEVHFLIPLYLASHTVPPSTSLLLPSNLWRWLLFLPACIFVDVVVFDKILEKVSTSVPCELRPVTSSCSYSHQHTPFVSLEGASRWLDAAST
jgi:CRP-like cAMP-binding protein